MTHECRITLEPPYLRPMGAVPAEQFEALQTIVADHLASGGTPKSAAEAIGVVPGSWNDVMAIGDLVTD